jgi:hypothetical protein
MAFTLVQNILGSECIGTSRQKIVDNFTSLESTVIALSSQTINTTDTNTIDFTYNNTTRNLQATIKDNSIQESFLQSNSVSTNKIADNSVTYDKLYTDVTPKLAKAWVNFNGTTNPPTINASYNVSGVVKNSVGDYTITFENSLGTPNYSVCGTSRHQTTNTSNLGFGTSVTLHPTEAPTDTTVRIWNTSFQKTNVVSNIMSEADSSSISVQVFA